MLTAVLVVLLGSKADQFKLVTASKDHSLHLWQVPMRQEEESTTSTTTIRPVKLFKGHKASVQSISASPSGSEVFDQMHLDLFSIKLHIW
jgi:WD40 repeat protein